MHTHRNLHSRYARFTLSIAATMALATAIASPAQQAPGPGNEPGSGAANIVRVSTPDHARIPAASGRLNYTAYCSSCHGAAGKGDGPAAPSLKQKPTDLTQLAANNHGKFPWTIVSNVLETPDGQPEHGTSTMPNWWLAFRMQDPGTTTKFTASVRVHNLATYLQSMQAPAH